MPGFFFFSTQQGVGHPAFPQAEATVSRIMQHDFIVEEPLHPLAKTVQSPDHNTTAVIVFEENTELHPCCAVYPHPRQRTAHLVGCGLTRKHFRGVWRARGAIYCYGQAARLPKGLQYFFFFFFVIASALRWSRIAGSVSLVTLLNLTCIMVTTWQGFSRNIVCRVDNL